MPRKRVSTQIIGHSLSSRSRHKYHEMVAQIPLQMGGGGPKIFEINVCEAF